MPSYRAHLLLGLVIALLGIALTFTLVPELDALSGTLLLALTLCGSLFPDIDTVSRVGRMAELLLPAGALCALVSHRFMAAAALLLFLLFVKIIPHRTITHRPLFLIFFPLLLCYNFSQTYPRYNFFFYTGAIFFIAGTLSHVWIDKKITRIKRKLRRR